jgi:hypothetical protein
MIKRPIYPAPALRNIGDIKAASVTRKFEDTMRGLHSILVGPASKPQEVKHAKERMLKVLEERRRMPLASALIPPLTTPPRKRKGTRQTPLALLGSRSSSPIRAQRSLADGHRNLTEPEIEIKQ